MTTFSYIVSLDLTLIHLHCPHNPFSSPSFGPLPSPSDPTSAFTSYTDSQDPVFAQRETWY